MTRLKTSSPYRKSDILVTAKSTFSYLAGLINLTGLVIYEPFWFPPWDDWIQNDREGQMRGHLHAGLTDKLRSLVDSATV